MRIVFLICTLLALPASGLLERTFLSGTAAAQAAPEKRVALVIGNNAYTELNPLHNPRLDAERMARLLSERGFDTVSCDGKRPGCFDLTRDGLTAAIAKLAEKAKGADLAFVFYAGHGVGAPEGNMLAPVDADVDCERQQVARGVLVDEVLEALAGARQKIVVLDACRDNPMGKICPPATKAKLSFRDFKIPDAGNFLLVSSTKPGQTADDGLPGQHSPFARALFASLAETPNVHFHQVFDRVSKAVIEETSKGNFTQIPEMLIRGGAPETCLAGEGCAADPHAAALTAELDALKRDRARDQELGETAKEYLAQLEKQRGKPFTEDERRRELASLKEATRSLAARNDNRGERALAKLSAGETSEAERLFQEDLDAGAAEERAQAQRLLEQRKKRAASARNIAALARWKDVAKAATYYKQAVDLDPDNAQTWDDYARVAQEAGRTDDAKAAFEQAASKANGDDADSIRYWAINGRGDVLVDQGNLPDALKSYRGSLGIAGRLAKADPNNAGWQRDLSVSYEKVGDVLVAQGNLTGALESYRGSLGIAGRLAKADPNNAGWQYDLGISNERIGGVLMAQGDLAAALRSYQAKQEIISRLAKADPNNAGWQRDLSVSYDKVGGVLVAQGNLTGALESYRGSLGIAGRLAKADPNNAGWQYDLGISNERIGGVLMAQGDLAAALRSYQAKQEIISRLAKADPNNAGWQRDLWVSYGKIADVLIAQGNLAGGLSNWNAAHEITARLAKADPNNAGWQRDLSVSYNNVGGVLVAQGNLTGALESYRGSLGIAGRLAKADPNNAGWQRDLSVSYNKVGDVLVAQGNLTGALESYRGSLGIADRLAKADPNNAGWQRDLSVSYNKVGDVLVAQGNLTGALESYRGSLGIRDRLAKADPNNAGWQRDVAVSYAKLADIYRRQGGMAQAKDSLGKGKEIMARMTALSPDNAQWKKDLGWFEAEIAALDASPYEEARAQIEAAYGAGDFAKAAAAQARLAADIEKAERGKAGKPGPDTASAMLGLAWYRLFERDFGGALAASDHGIALRPDWLPLATNKAHALMFLGRVREARALYLRYKGQRVEAGGKLWEEAIAEDFKEFEKRGLKHRRMAEIAALLAGK